MRQYQAIWEQIKLAKRATIVAPAHAHARIIQAVMKERSADLPFRRLIRKNGLTLELKKDCDTEKGTIQFNLVEIRGVRVSDL